MQIEKTNNLSFNTEIDSGWYSLLLPSLDNVITLGENKKLDEGNIENQLKLFYQFLYNSAYENEQSSLSLEKINIKKIKEDGGTISYELFVENVENKDILKIDVKKQIEENEQNLTSYYNVDNYFLAMPNYEVSNIYFSSSKEEQENQNNIVELEPFFKEFKGYINDPCINRLKLQIDAKNMTDSVVKYITNNPDDVITSEIKKNIPLFGQVLFLVTLISPIIHYLMYGSIFLGNESKVNTLSSIVGGVGNVANFVNEKYSHNNIQQSFKKNFVEIINPKNKNSDVSKRENVSTHIEQVDKSMYQNEQDLIQNQIIDEELIKWNEGDKKFEESSSVKEQNKISNNDLLKNFVNSNWNEEDFKVAFKEIDKGFNINNREKITCFSKLTNKDKENFISWLIYNGVSCKNFNFYNRFAIDNPAQADACIQSAVIVLNKSNDSGDWPESKKLALAVIQWKNAIKKLENIKQP